MVDSTKPRVTRIQVATFHVSGLYLMGRKEVRFVVPSVFSPMGWVRRKLTGSEMCQVWDIPQDIAKILNPKEIGMICKGPTPPFPMKIVDNSLSGNCSRKRPVAVIDSESEKQLRLTTEVNVDGEVRGPSEAVQDTEMERKLRAVKADDAAVPEYLWDFVLVPSKDMLKISKLQILRNFVLQWLKKRIQWQFLKWFYGKYQRLTKALGAGTFSNYSSWRRTLERHLGKSKEARLDWTAGTECMTRYANAEWWEWTGGSRPHFWR
jgi:hypothetical protein